MNKTCIVIAGPTAVGKTSVAIEIAKHFSTQIISSDSRQCYTELNIGVAKPSPQQLLEIQHHFINSHTIFDVVSAADFEHYALEKATALFEQSDVIVVVGGTGLYIKAFCDGLDDIPTANSEVRMVLHEQYQQHGIGWLSQQLAEKDPIFYKNGEMKNPHRMMRALEVMEVSGKSILLYYSGEKKKRDFELIKVGLELQRDTLYENINNRTDQMMRSGLLQEVEGLLAYKHNNALQTVGYKELFAYIDGAISLKRAVELIKQNTRHYAKRQMTWFKKDEEFSWARPDDTPNLLSVISQKIKSSK